MFSRDPFFTSMFGNDPFFAQMHRNPFPNMDHFHNLDQFFQPGFPGDPFARPTARRQAPTAQQHRVTVEEVDDEDDLPRQSSQPTVEEPDEGTHAWSSRSQQDDHVRRHEDVPAYARPARSQQRDRAVAMPAERYSALQGSAGRPSMVSCSSSSSFVSYGGPGGATFTRTQSTRTGPGGVAEYAESYSDGRRGEGRSQHSRFIGERGRTTQRTWSSNGLGNNQDILHNIQDSQAANFEQDWAGRSRPRLGSSRYDSRDTLPNRMY